MKLAKKLNIGKQLKYVWITQQPNLNNRKVLEQIFKIQKKIERNT